MVLGPNTSLQTSAPLPVFQSPAGFGWSSDHVKPPVRVSLVPFQSPAGFGWSSDSQRRCWTHHPTCGFNPLRGSDGPRTAPSTPTSLRSMLVSIPCGVRMVLGHGRIDIDVELDRRVSIPCGVRMVLGPASRMAHDRIRGACFNPLRGSDGPRTIANPALVLVHRLVSIPCGVRMVLGPPVAGSVQLNESGFNPLRGSDGPRTAAAWKAVQMYAPVSIPCGVRMVLGRSSSVILCTTGCMFQSPAGFGWSSDVFVNCGFSLASYGFNPLRGSDGPRTGMSLYHS